MTDPRNSFATAINCMDGRVQIPVSVFLRARFGVAYIDTVTEAGPVAALAGFADSPGSGGSVPEVAESVRRRVAVSVEAHNSQGIAVAAHEGCAGNPIADEMQKAQCLDAAEAIRADWPDLPVLALWVTLDGTVEELRA